MNDNFVDLVSSYLNEATPPFHIPPVPPPDEYRKMIKNQEKKKMKDPFMTRLSEKDRKSLARDLKIQKLIDKEGFRKSMEKIMAVRRAEESGKEKKSKSGFHVGDTLISDMLGKAKVVGETQDGKYEIRFPNGHVMVYSKRTIENEFKIHNAHLTGSTGPG